jgi:hypothetical protein
LEKLDANSSKKFLGYARWNLFPRWSYCDGRYDRRSDFNALDLIFAYLPMGFLAAELAGSNRSRPDAD